MIIVPTYAAILGLLFIYLSRRVIKTRRRERIAVGDGGNPHMQRAIAVHNNFAQYVPLALLLLAFLEMQQGSTILIQILCAALLIARLLHAYGVSQMRENFRFRIAGILMTFGVIGLTALLLLFSAIVRLI
jgi:uncharacterized membrane protein YecN with MAPEG domain